MEKDGKPVALSRTKILLYSLTSVQTAPVRSQEHSVMMISRDLQERRDWILLMYALLIMMTIANKLVAFHKVQLHNTFGEYLAAHDMTQVRIAETEKYAHVTFFFNGGVGERTRERIKSL